MNPPAVVFVGMLCSSMLSKPVCGQSEPKTEFPSISLLPESGSMTAAQTLYLPFSTPDLNLKITTLLYKIKCGDERNNEKPWIADSDVDKIVKFGECKDFLANPYVSLNYFRTPSRVQVQALPAVQTYDGLQISSPDPGIPREFVSTCCTTEECRKKCLDLTKMDQECQFEIYTLQVTEPYDGWVEFGKAFQYTPNNRPRELKLRYLFRIKCKLCLQTSCVRDCKNGQVSYFHAWFLM